MKVVAAAAVAVAVAAASVDGEFSNPGFLEVDASVTTVKADQPSYPMTLTGGNGGTECTLDAEGKWTLNNVDHYGPCSGDTITGGGKAKNRTPFGAAKNIPESRFCFTGAVNAGGNAQYSTSGTASKNEWALCEETSEVQFTTPFTATGDNLDGACVWQWNYNNRTVAGDSAPIFLVTNACVSFKELQPHTATADLSNIEDLEEKFWCFTGEGQGYNPNKAGDGDGGFDPKVRDWGICADAAAVAPETDSPTASETPAPSASGETPAPTLSPTLSPEAGVDPSTPAPVAEVTPAPTSAPLGENETASPTAQPTETPTIGQVNKTVTDSPTRSAGAVQAASLVLCAVVAVLAASWQ